MVRKRVEDPPPELPAWIMTFSDVITLLMTFFILLLTFSSNEKEKFERMQTAMFGGGVGTGFAQDTEALTDSVVMRTRPKASRLSTRGSESAPIHKDANLSSMGLGLKSLDADEDTGPSLDREIRLSMPLLIDDNDSLTQLARRVLEMIARQLGKFNFEIEFQVSDKDDLDRALILAQYLAQEHFILPGRIGVGLKISRRSSSQLERTVEIVLTQQLKD